MLESLQGVTSAVVRVALDGLAQQQRVIANNIANAGSAGYSARQVEFEDALRAAAQPGFSADADAIKTRLARLGADIEAGTHIRPAADPQVQVDLEMARLNATVMKYQALIQALNQSGSFVRMAVSGDGSR